MATTEFRGFPEVMTGTHGPDDGAGQGTPWPEDVPPDQDDTWYPLRDDPWKAARMEYLIAFLWGVTAICGLLLMVVYWTGGQAQYEVTFSWAVSAAWAPGSSSGRAICCPARRSPPAEVSTSPMPRRAPPWSNRCPGEPNR